MLLPILFCSLLGAATAEDGCLNGAKFDAARKSCHCPSPFFGDQCERWRCGDGGDCATAAGSPTCSVVSSSSSGGRKAHCALRCKGETGGVGDVPCVCPSGVDGAFCTIVTHCNRRGRLLRPRGGDAYCSCFPGFLGPTCLGLDHSVCRNDGRLAANRSCVCAPRYFGSQCEKYCTVGGDIASSLLLHEGLRIPHTYCHCLPEYSGELCAHLKGVPTGEGREGSSHLSNTAVALITLGLILAMLGYFRRRSVDERLRRMNAAAAVLQLPPVSAQRRSEAPPSESELPSYEEVMRATQSINARHVDAADLHIPADLMFSARRI